MTFIDKWSLFVSYSVLLNQWRVVTKWPIFIGWFFFRVVLNTGLYIDFNKEIQITRALDKRCDKAVVFLNNIF
jgi:hypothetical protein